MAVTRFSSRKFNQDTSAVKRAARNGPVVITDRGRPAHVLMTFEDYRKLTRRSASIIEMLGMPGIEDVEFDPPRAGTLGLPPDLS